MALSSTNPNRNSHPRPYRKKSTPAAAAAAILLTMLTALITPTTATPIPYDIASLDHSRLDARTLARIEELRFAGWSDHDIARRFAVADGEGDDLMSGEYDARDEDESFLHGLLAYIHPANKIAQENALATIDQHESEAQTAAGSASQKQKRAELHGSSSSPSLSSSWAAPGVPDWQQSVWKIVEGFVRMRGSNGWIGGAGVGAGAHAAAGCAGEKDGAGGSALDADPDADPDATASASDSDSGSDTGPTTHRVANAEVEDVLNPVQWVVFEG